MVAREYEYRASYLNPAHAFGRALADRGRQAVICGSRIRMHGPRADGVSFAIILESVALTDIVCEADSRARRAVAGWARAQAK